MVFAPAPSTLASALTSLEMREVDLYPPVVQHRKNEAADHHHVYYAHQQQLVLLHAVPRQVLVLQHQLLRVIHHSLSDLLYKLTLYID